MVLTIVIISDVRSDSPVPDTFSRYYNIYVFRVLGPIGRR